MARRVPLAPLPGAGVATRAGVALGAALFALVAVASGVDRHWAMRSTPDPLPDRLAAAAVQARVVRAINTQNIEAADQQGRLLIAREPINPLGPAAIGYAHWLAGDLAGAEAGFAVSGQLGWRSPSTQAYWMQRALAVGDARVAALRLDALLRQSPEMAANPTLLAPFEADPAVRAALIDRMVLAPVWLKSYREEVSALPPQASASRAAVLEALRARGVVLGCEGVRPLTEQLLKQGGAQQAAALWNAHCPDPGRPGGLLHDGALARVALNGPEASLGWTPVNSGDVGLAPLDGGGIELTGSAPFTTPVLAQLVVVAPGTYRLTWKAGDSSGASAPRVVARVGCTMDMGDDVVPQSAGAGRWQAMLTIDADCSAHWLRLALRPGTGTVRLGEVALRPAGR